MRKLGARFWVKALAVLCAVTCAITLLFAIIGGAPKAAAAGPGLGQIARPAQSAAAAQSSPNHALSQSAAVQLQAYEGVITDTHCGAKHSAAIAETAADCTRVCVHAGDHFALVDGDKMFVLDGEQEALKHAAGERVKITGTLNGNTISVVSVRTPQS